MARFENVIPVNAELEKKFGISYLIKSGKTLYIAGLLSADDTTFELVGAGDMAAQIRHIYKRMEMILAKAGCTLHHVVSEINFTTDMAATKGAAGTRTEIYRRAGAAPPVATAVQVAGLYLPGALIEVHATAELD